MRDSEPSSELITRSGKPVNRLGYGTLTLATCQKNLSPHAATTLFSHAHKCGINWFDTAEYYDNYEQLATFLKINDPDDLFISSKSYAYDHVGMDKSLDLARRHLAVDTIDLFMLHEQESDRTLAGHSDAFYALLEAKEKGIVRYVGVSTHAISVVQAMAGAKRGESPRDRDFDTSLYKHADVVFALLSATGIGLLDGSAADMDAACASADLSGLTVLGMKVFGGGHLLGSRRAVVSDALNKSYVRAWSVGMGSVAEIDTNVAWFSNRQPSFHALNRSAKAARKLHVTSDCSRCGRCVERCQSGAMSLGPTKALCDPTKCTLCSYCAYVCRDFAIKIY